MSKAMLINCLVIALALNAVVAMSANRVAAATWVPTAQVGQHSTVALEVASSPEEIQHGLMGRTAMPEDTGMVFLFHPHRSVNFWMYHTIIPLDMLFIRDGRIVRLFENVPPCRSEDPAGCPTYPQGAGIDVTEVLELNAGYAKRHGITEGQPVTFDLTARSKSEQR